MAAAKPLHHASTVPNMSRLKLAGGGFSTRPPGPMDVDANESDEDEPVVFSLETLKDHIVVAGASENSNRLTSSRKSLSQSISRIQSVQKKKRSFMLSQHKGHKEKARERRKSQISREAAEFGLDVDHNARRASLSQVHTLHQIYDGEEDGG